MFDPFSAALAVLHSAAGSVEAIYTPVPGGLPLPIRAIRIQSTREVAAGQGAVLMDTNIVQIRRWDVDHPKADDLVAIITRDAAGNVVLQEPFAIQGGARLDDEGITWNCDVEPA